MHEPNRLIHELHVVEQERDEALAALEDARALAVLLEHQVAWMTPSFRRNPEAFPQARGLAVYDGQGLA